MRDFPTVWPTTQPRQGELRPRTWIWVRFVFFWGLLLLFGVDCGWGQWTEPQLVDPYEDSTGINVWGWDWCPFITGEGQVMYLASDRGPGTDFDLYVSTWNGTTWTDPLRLPFCQEGVDERNPATNVGDDTLYFVSQGIGGWDIFWSFRNGFTDTSWAAPQRMPEPINSNGIEFSICVTPDNRRLLFSSARQGGMGGEDIYQCRREPNSETGWAVPTILPGPMNTAFIESYPTMGFDSTEIFYWRSSRLCISHLVEGSWSLGEWLPEIINRRVQNFPTETTPFITPDGRRLYFASSYGNPPTVKDIWYSDRITSVAPRSEGRQGRLPIFRVYPNPARDYLEIHSADSFTRVVVLNLLGQELANLSIFPPAYSTHIDLRTQLGYTTSGTYLISTQTRTSSYTLPVFLIR